MDVTIDNFTAALASWGIKQVLIGEAYSTAADGATPVLTQLWSNTYIWVGKGGKTFGMPEKGEELALEGLGVPTLQGE